MNSLQFVNALAADPTARVFIDKYGCASVAARDAAGRWVAHTDTTCPGAEISEDDLFERENHHAWRLEQDHVVARYRDSLIEIELAEPLPTTIQVGFDVGAGPRGETVRVEHVVGGERVITIERGDLAKYPGARVL